MNPIIFRFIRTVVYMGYKIAQNKNVQGYTSE